MLLAVGCRFADESTSSYRRCVSFNIPPTRLIHADIDPAEVGKNYPVTEGLVGDAGTVLQGLLEELGPPGEDYRTKPYTGEIAKGRATWLASLAGGELGAGQFYQL